MNIAGPELLLEIDIGRGLHQMLIDSGASVSVIKPGIIASEIQTTQTFGRGITRNRLKVMGKRTFIHEFLIALLNTEYSGILGVDVLRHMGARVDLRTSTLLLGWKQYPFQGRRSGGAN
jgi:hypothetical protein